ncbi:hypothetical protein BH09ACT8_BH09ACT8_62850 [soil metagenome]
MRHRDLPLYSEEWRPGGCLVSLDTRHGPPCLSVDINRAGRTNLLLMTDRSSSVQRAYDAVAREYDRQISDELDEKPLDRAWLRAFVDLVGTGTIADVGCGPGHVTRYLATLHNDVVGIDLSPAMITIARERAPRLTFTIESMLTLAAGDEAWAGVVAWYSIIHLEAHERPVAFSEFARVLQAWRTPADRFSHRQPRVRNWTGQPHQRLVRTTCPTRRILPGPR